MRRTQLEVTMAELETSPLAGGTVHSFSVDASAVGNHEASECLLALIRRQGFGCTRLDRFWRSLVDASITPPEGLLVLGDLSAVAKRSMGVNPHRFAAAVRKTRPYFIVLVRTRTDRHYISAVDELLRVSAMRATICCTPETDFLTCLLKAASALEPDSLIDLRCSPVTRELWIEFGDGLFGSISLARVMPEEEIEDLVLHTATVGDNGNTVEISKKNGDLFRIDASSLRETLSGARRPLAPHTRVGNCVRSARIRAGVSQSMLAEKTGMHQTRISRLEHGQHCPRLDTLERVATVLGCSVAELLSEG